MDHRTRIEEALTLIFQGIGMLKEQFPGKAFTVDGRLVGDVGEVIAALEYEVDLYDRLIPVHDGETLDGRKVQIKATFKDRLSLTTVPEFYLGLRLFEDGTYEEIYNGPGSIIAERFSHLKGFGEKQLSFPLADLRELSKGVSSEQRVSRRVLRPCIESVMSGGRGKAARALQSGRAMHRVDLEEVEGRLAELIAEAADGEDVVITRSDGASFKIVPVMGSRPKFGSARGLVEMSEDFDEPLEDFEDYAP